MTWEDWHSARQLLAEEFLGAPLREHVRVEQAAEDQAAETTKAAIRASERRMNGRPRPVDDLSI